MTSEDLKRIYSASSDHALLDQVVTCNDCALVYLNPRPRADLLSNGYSRAVDPLFAEQNDHRIRTFHRTLRGVLKRINLPGRGMKVLDVGCAGGAFLVAARTCGMDAVGVEPALWMAAHGRERYEIDIRDGYLAEGMFQEASFDMITLWDVIEHMPEPHASLSLIRKLLKPDGVLLVNFPDIASLAARLLGERWPFWLGVHLIYYTRKTMAAQLARAGFEVRWFEPCWQTLQFAYVARRAVPYFRPLSVVPPLLERLGLARLPFTYNMGQTLAVTRPVHL